MILLAVSRISSLISCMLNCMRSQRAFPWLSTSNSRGLLWRSMSRVILLTLPSWAAARA